jgi:hypothetical protein
MTQGGNMSEAIVYNHEKAQSRREVLKLLASGGAIAATAPALLAQERLVIQRDPVCVETELSPEGLVRSARYMRGTVPVVLTLTQTGPKTHRTEITSNKEPILTVDGDFNGLGKNKRFGVATVNLRSNGKNWSITLDGSETQLIQGRIPTEGRIPIQIRVGEKKTITGAFDIASQRVMGLQEAGNIETLLDPHVATACQPFLPALEAVVGYTSRNSRHGMNVGLRPGIGICTVVCGISLIAALAICGAAAGAGPVGWAVCALAAYLAYQLCVAAC